tara:strand:- start:493 stop:834 length:342 start_codon:yes stop_codon:yes gene_type:complete
MYKALHSALTINNSSIRGLGIFATQDVPPNIDLGISHVRNGVGHFENNYIRTPLGGLINHSDEPNCIKYQPFVLASPPIESGYEPTFYSIKTLRFIEKGEELTIFYTLYKIDE